ncbi:MAG TPA: NAD(P)-dependent oxidoreductase [Rhizomicrobium sp.]
MLPITLSPETTRVGLIGQGDALGRRAALLVAAGVSATLLPSDADEAELAPLHLLFIAGLDALASRALFSKARGLGVLVNVEDAPEICDFHVPALVRRGDLLLTASTGGKAPALSRQLREWLAGQFGPEWSDRLADVESARKDWRAEGLAPSEVSERTRGFVTERGWL